MRASGAIQRRIAKLQSSDISPAARGLKKQGVDPMFIRNLMISSFGLALMLISATDVSAATFNQTHPRRAEVNHRLAVENARIRHGVKEGTITPKEAAQLHSEAHGVRVEERI